jgi:hypothetical protein
MAQKKLAGSGWLPRMSGRNDVESHPPDESQHTQPKDKKARLDVIEKAGTLRNHIQSRGGI